MVQLITEALTFDQAGIEVLHEGKDGKAKDLFMKGVFIQGDDPVRVNAAGLVCFGARYVYAFIGAICNVHIHIGVRLLMRSFTAVALDVSHRTSDHIAS